MKYIDLRKEYPHLDSTYSEYPVSYKIDAMFEQYRLAEQALEKRRCRNGDVISLDNEPGVEAQILERVPGPEEEVMRLADRLAVIDDGKLVDSGPVAEAWLRLMQNKGRKAGRSLLVLGSVQERDSAWGLMKVVSGGMHFWVRDTGGAIGSSVRLMINADDVSLSVEKPSQTSIQNVFACRITAIQDGADVSRKVVEVESQGTVIMAELTGRAAHELQLEPGMEVWAQVKTIAVH